MVGLGFRSGLLIEASAPLIALSSQISSGCVPSFDKTGGFSVGGVVVESLGGVGFTVNYIVNLLDHPFNLRHSHGGTGCGSAQRPR